MPAIRATLDSIAVMPTIKQLIVAQLDAESVKAINKATNSTNIDHRRDNMTKVIFAQQLAAIWFQYFLSVAVNERLRMTWCGSTA